MPLPKDNLLFGFAPKLTDEQKEFVDAIFDNTITICDSKSGTGKTTLSVACAKLLGEPLYYIFSPCQESKLGFLPGDLEGKTDVYWQPLKDALIEIGEQPEKAIASQENIDNIKNGNAWVFPMPHVYARGINLKDATIILDECQTGREEISKRF